MTALIRTIRSCHRCESGAAAIEFSIVGFVMILVMLGVIEFGRGLLVRNEIAYLSDIGSRKTLIDPAISEDALRDAMRAAFSRDRSLLQIAVSTETIDNTQYRIIAIAYPMSLLVPGLSSQALSLQVSRRIPLE